MPSARPCILFLTLLLGACGGGGGGGGSSPAPPSTPTANALSDSATVDEDGSVTINVLANDIQVSSSSLTVDSSPANGTATLDGTSIAYTPSENFNGNDSFTYAVNSNAGAALTATVSITVSDINDSPVASNTMLTLNLVEDTPTAIDAAENSSDIDGEISTADLLNTPDQGSVTIDGTILTYLPNENFTGEDQFSYTATDDDGAQSEAITVSLTITAITDTELTVTELVIPTTGYSSENSAEYETTILASPVQTLTVPPNTVSVLLSLRGDQVGDKADEANVLFISTFQSPDNNITTFRQTVGFCDGGLCSAFVPRRPDIKPDRGDWQFQLATFDSDLDGINTENMVLDVAIRTGPAPDVSQTFPATLQVKPFLTATSITTADLDTVLSRFVNIASENGLSIELLPTTIGEPRFAEVSPDFNDQNTIDLVSMGQTDAANIFFLESFTGANGGAILGISGGIPGTQGTAGRFNGILVNATTFFERVEDGGIYYTRNTAQVSFHEMSHHLGLYHTTEGDFSFNDVLNDTPDCTEDDDTNSNGLADIDECTDGNNPMFWKPDLLNTIGPASNDQRQILFGTPIARP